MAYPFQEIEKRWQQYWKDNKTFQAVTPSPSGEGGGEVKPKYYALDMFPYPSGTGLHVGHPLGYIASDIVSRYKRLKGFNVLHPMGYDSFGLPAEQYAIQTGQHPSITTENNIARYREQMDKIGFSFDWAREVRTSDPNYYKWTQWIFLKLFNSWYNPETDKAEPIETLIPKLKNYSRLSEKEKSDLLMNYRVAYLSESWVNWCPQLGTVLANEEVKDGVSERGGYPVERKLMPQWSLRITAYAERLLNDLEKIDWSESIKESQRNWIGKSEGSSLRFQVSDSKLMIEVFTTRPDTVFGVTFLTLAPESDLVSQLSTPEQKQKVEAYVHYAKNRSERERQADVKKVTGEFMGSYCIHPFTGEKLPIWIGEYVLAGYGTGAVMGVPAHDSRDHSFAKHFGLEIKQVVEAPAGWDIQKESFDAKEGKCINSDFINGLEVKDAIKKIISEIEKHGLGKGKTQFRLRDAIFGRQRYWGEPIPIYYRLSPSLSEGEGAKIPCAVEEKHLPIELPQIEKYLPTESGNPPLARAEKWYYDPEQGIISPPLRGGKGGALELTTMPGWAGSSWYYLRYMDAHNEKEFASKEAINYWRDVDLYIGGSEHATGHLLYVRFWTKFLHDLGYLPIVEPAKKLINQGMIQGVSQFVKEIRVAPSIISKYEKQHKKLRIIKDKKVIKELDVPCGILHQHVFCSFNTKFEFEYYLSDSGEKLETVFAPTRAKVDFVYEVAVNSEQYFSHTLIDKWLRAEPDYRPIVITDIAVEAYWDYRKKYWCDFSDTKIENQNSAYWITKSEVEKMSKSKNNVVSPDNTVYPYKRELEKDYQYYFGNEKPEVIIPGIVEKYGTDCLRMYEMFLGPLEMSKPWNTNGISGVFNFLNRFWRLFHKENPTKNTEEKIQNPDFWEVSDAEPTKQELKILHRTIKKIQQDIENYSFNTAVSAFMICTNELTELKCNKKKILEPLVILLSPFAPHITEELWNKLGYKESVTFTSFPQYNDALTVDNSFAYPVSFNGKMRFNIELSLNLSPAEIEKEVLAFDQTKKYLEGKQPKKIIVVPKRIVNIVV